MKKVNINYGSFREQEQEKNLQLRFRQFIYFTFHQILEVKAISEVVAIILVFIQILQLIAMTSSKNNDYIMDSILSQIFQYSDYVLIYPLIQDSSSIIINYVFFCFSLIILIFLIWGSKYIYESKNQEEIYLKQFKNIYSLIYDFLEKVLSTPITGLFFINLICAGKFECFTVQHIILIFLSFITFALLVCAEILYVLLFFNFTFKLKDCLSRNPSELSMIFFFQKKILTLFNIVLYLPDKNQFTFYVLLHLVSSGTYLYDSLNRFPYHQKNVSKTYGLSCAAYLWFNLTYAGVFVARMKFMVQNPIIFVGLGVIFFVKLYLNIRNYFSKVIMIRDLQDITSDILLDIKIRTYNLLAKNMHIKKSELLLASLLKIHYDKCTEIEVCPCRHRTGLYDPKKQSYADSTSQFHRDSVFVKHFIRRMITDGQEKFRDSKLMYLNFLFYQFESLRLYAPVYGSIFKFFQLFGQNNDLSIEFCLSRLHQKMANFILNKNHKNSVCDVLTIEHVKKFDYGLVKIRDDAVQVAKLFARQWECLQDQIPDLSKLLDVCHENTNKINETQILYKELITLNNTSQTLKNIMDIYASHLVYDELLAIQVSKDIHLLSTMEIGNSVNQDIDFVLKKYNIFDENVCVVALSSNLETMSQITWSSKNATHVFGFSEHELRSRSINTLMPSIYAQNHDNILKHFYNSGKEKLINNLMHSWAIDNKGFCFSANIFVKIVPRDDDYEIMGLIHKLNAQDYIVTDRDGEISAIGYKFAELLNIRPKTLYERRINIQLLAPKLMDLYLDYFKDFGEEDDVENFKFQGQNIGVNQTSTTLTNLDLQQQQQQLTKSKKDQQFGQLRIISAQQTVDATFILFVPMDIESILKDHFEKRKILFKKYLGNDLSMLKDRELKDIKRLVNFKTDYANYLYNGLKRLNKKRLEKVIKVKAQIQIYSFMSGDTKLTVKAIKIQSADVKKSSYVSTDKIKKQNVFLKSFVQEIKKCQSDFKAKNLRRQQEEKKQAEEEAAEQDEQNNDDNTQSKNPQEKKFKGILKMFGKSGIFGGKKKAMNPFAKLAAKQQDDPADQQQIDDQIKTTIISQFKPSNKWIKAARRARPSYLTQSEDEGYNDLLLMQQQQQQMQQNGTVQPPNKTQSQPASISSIQLNSPTNQQQQMEDSQQPLVSNLSFQPNSSNNVNPRDDLDDGINQPLSSRKRKPSLGHQHTLKSEQEIALQEKEKSSNIFPTIQNRRMSRRKSTVSKLQPLKREPTLVFINKTEEKVQNQSPQNFKDQFPLEKQSTQNLEDKINNPVVGIEVSKEGEDAMMPNKKIKRSEEQQVVVMNANKIRNALIKQGVIGLKVHSWFYNVSQIKRSESGLLFDSGEETEQDKKNDSIDKQKTEASGLKKLQKLNEQGKIKEFAKQQTGKTNKSRGHQQQHDTSSSSDEQSNDDEVKLLLKSEKSKQSVQIERNLLDQLERKDVKEEEKAIQASVGSSTASMNTQNALRIIRNSIKNQKTPMILRTANYLTIMMCLILFSLSIAQNSILVQDIKDFKENLYFLDRVTIYSENMTEFYSDFLDIALVENQLYLDTWYTEPVMEVHRNRISTNLQKFSNFYLYDLSKAGSNRQGDQDLQSYLFLPMQTKMLVGNNEEEITVSFQNFVRQFSNAINQTVNLPLDFFSQSNFRTNDYLFFIRNNWPFLTKQIDYNFEIAASMLENQLDRMQLHILWLWGLSFSIIFLCYLFIYPVILKSKIKIHDSLALFVKISLRDVDYYLEHYKRIAFLLQNIEHPGKLVSEVEKFLEYEQNLFRNQKKALDNRALSRSRSYKGIHFLNKLTFLLTIIHQSGVKINKVTFFLQMTFALSLFVMFLILKDISLVQFQLETYDIYKTQLRHRKLYSNSIRTLADFKESILNLKYNYSMHLFSQEREAIQLNLHSNVTQLMIDNYKLIGILDSSFQDYIDTLISSNLCDQVIYQSDQQNEYEYCNILGLGLMKRGFTNFFIEYENYIQNGLDLIYKLFIDDTSGNNQQSIQQQAYQLLRNFLIFDVRQMQEYIALLSFRIYNKQEETLFLGIDDELQFNKTLLICFICFIFLFLLVVWVSIYIDLSRNSRWISGFIVLIPINILKENQYLRSYLKRKLHINSLIYT